MIVIPKKLSKSWIFRNSFDEFGYLDERNPIFFDQYSIIPNNRFNANRQHAIKYGNKDGFYYPPEVNTYTYDPFSLKKKRKKQPNTQRPAQIFRIIPTHLICSPSSPERCAAHLIMIIFR